MSLESWERDQRRADEDRKDMAGFACGSPQMLALSLPFKVISASDSRRNSKRINFVVHQVRLVLLVSPFVFLPL